MVSQNTPSNFSVVREGTIKYGPCAGSRETSIDSNRFLNICHRNSPMRKRRHPDITRLRRAFWSLGVSPGGGILNSKR